MKVGMKESATPPSTKSTAISCNRARSRAPRPKVPMTVRTTTKNVTFRHPFSIRGVDDVQPPGTYAIETAEEQLPGLSFLAYRRISTTIVLSAAYGGSPARQMITIEPSDLEAAQARDLLTEGA